MLVERDRDKQGVKEKKAPPKPAPPPKLKSTKTLWESSDHDDEPDILDRFLKVKHFAENQQPSCESEYITGLFL